MQMPSDEHHVQFEEDQMGFSSSAAQTSPKEGMTASLAQSMKVSPSTASALLALVAIAMLAGGWYFYKKSQPPEKPLTPVEIQRLEDSLRPTNQR